MLANRKELYKQYKNDPVLLKQQRSLTPADYKDEHEWLREVDSLALANAQLNLNSAYQKFFNEKNVGFPKFKKKHKSKKSYTTNNQKGSVRLVDAKHIKLPKVGNVRIKLHRQLPKNSVIKSVTITLTPAGRYYISILVETTEVELAKVTPTEVLGLDYVSSSLYTDSQAYNADYPRFYRRTEKKLKRAQRKLSKCTKGSNNWHKQRLRVAQLYEKIANQRLDFLHKLSYKLAESYDAVAVEDLDMQNMSRCLNLGKSTMDNGFGTFRRFLDYKLTDRGKHFVTIDKWFPSSKLCNVCKTLNHELTLADRTWTCICGITHDRDINAAINIRNEGIRLLGAV